MRETEVAGKERERGTERMLETRCAPVTREQAVASETGRGQSLSFQVKFNMEMRVRVSLSLPSIPLVSLEKREVHERGFKRGVSSLLLLQFLS